MPVRRPIGPILTTAAALLIAAVVVANPITAPHADVRIPAVKLSAGSDPSSTGMLDESFLTAIAPSPPDSTSPLSVLRQLFASVAADVTYIGRTALLQAFVAGVDAVTGPALTSASIPYVDSPSGFPAALTPGLDALPIAARSYGTPSGSSADSPVGSLSAIPTLRDVIAGIAADARYVSDQLVAAAYATGKAVAVEPQLIADTLRALASGDLDTAFDNVVKALSTPFGPPAIILDALKTIVVNRLTHAPGTGAVQTPNTRTPPAAVVIMAERAVRLSAGRQARQSLRGGGPAHGSPSPHPAASVNPAQVRGTASESVAPQSAPSAEPGVARHGAATATVKRTLRPARGRGSSLS